MIDFIDENNLTVYILTSEYEGKHYGMVATWICPASLRTDELRFTLALSKHNDSVNAIVRSRKFILHKISASSFKVALKMGSSHSNSVDKFLGEDFHVHESGLRVLKSSLAFGLASVISSMETEDRFILYCAVSKINSFDENTSGLTQKELFAQLSDDERKILGTKYINDSLRDTPKS